jgi:Na+/H+-dicarboxylate symporter
VLSAFWYGTLLLGSGVLVLLLAPMFFTLVPVANWPGPNTLERALGTGSIIGYPGRGGAAFFTALVPSNALRAAVDGAIFPLVVFSVALGAAITRISTQGRQKLSRFFDGVSDSLNKLVRMLMALAPYAVFLLALGLGVRFGAGAAGAGAVYVVLVSLLCIVLTLLLYPLALLSSGITLKRFASACFPPQTISLVAGSARPALPAMILAAERDLGVHAATSRSVLPVGYALFSVGKVVSLVAGAVLLARLFELDLTLGTYLSLVGSAAVVSITAPEVTAGPVIAMTPVYIHAGIPPEGVGVLMGLNAIPLAFQAVVSVTAHMTVATAIGGSAAAAAATSDIAAPSA